jgi:hypothetical protein
MFALSASSPLTEPTSPPDEAELLPFAPLTEPGSPPDEAELLPVALLSPG